MPRASSHGEYYAVRVGRRPGVYRSWAEAFAGLYPSTPTTTAAAATPAPKTQAQPPLLAAPLTRVIDATLEQPPSRHPSLPLPAVGESQLFTELHAPAGRGRIQRPTPYTLGDAKRTSQTPASGDAPSGSQRPESRSGVGSHGRVKPFSQISWDLEVSPPQPAGETADEIIVYTDGASSKNGQVGAKAGVGVYFGYLDPRNVSEPLAGNRQTNQRAELTAIVRALEKVMEHEEKPLETGSAALSGGLVKRIVVYTDSMYSINCLTKWYRKWENNGWIRKEKGTVENADLIQRALVLIRQRNGRVRFIHVKGHRGIEGNERADELAVRGCMLSEH